MKNLCSILFLVLSIQSFAQYEITPIHISGNTETFYTLVIVAEGYTASQLGDFKVDAQAAANVIFANPTYGSLKNNMNIYAISTPSKESGISLIANNPSPSDQIQETKKKDTFFNIYYQNSFRAYFVDDSSAIKARRVATEQIPFSDNALILVHDDNAPPSGKADIEYGVAVGPGRATSFFDEYIIRHELGHSLAGLADTYYVGQEESFNKTTNNNTNTIRWKEFLSIPDIGVFDIATPVEHSFCPNLKCMMRTVDNYFCPICENRIRQVILGKSKRIETPHRIITTNRSEASFQLSWDKIKGATKYEVVFMDNSSGGVLPQKVVLAPDTSAVFENLSLTKDFGNWIVNIRAYNDNYSTRFSARIRVPSMSFYPILPSAVPIPSQINITKLSATSVKINWKQDSKARLTFIRLYNEAGILSEITSDTLSVTLNGLVANQKYKISIATGIQNNDQTEFLSSLFSIPIEFSTNTESCNTGTTAPVLKYTNKSNVCPVISVSLLDAVNSTCPTGSILEWHTTNLNLSSTNKVANPSNVNEGIYYPVCFDALNNCYSPTPAIGLRVSTTPCCKDVCIPIVIKFGH